MRQRLLVIAKAVAGLLLGILLWWGAAGPYNEILAASAQPLVRAFERSPATRLEAIEGSIVVNRSDFPPGSPRPVLIAGHLTANIVLLTALFATNRRPLSMPNISAFILAALIIALIHVLAVVVNVHSIYAWEFGRWSEENYGRISRALWEGATHFYTLAGSFGSAFLLWYLTTKKIGA